MPAERLQKVLAAAGVASRRASEGLIAAGRVQVDGRRATLGQQVDPQTARIEVDGLPIGAAARTTYLLLHKPAGVTATTRDRHAETTVLDLIPTALVPDGGRLTVDVDADGKPLLDERVLHPRYGVEREYALAVRRQLDRDQVQALGEGIALEEGLATFHHLRLMTAVETSRLVDLLTPSPPAGLNWYRATLRQGWKRQLRRMFGAVDAPIERLVRVRIGPVRIDGLRSGRVRPLKAPEVRGLAAGGGRSRDDSRTPEGTRSTSPRPPKPFERPTTEHEKEQRQRQAR